MENESSEDLEVEVQSLFYHLVPKNQPICTFFLFLKLVPYLVSVWTIVSHYKHFTCSLSGIIKLLSFKHSSELEYWIAFLKFDNMNHFSKSLQRDLLFNNRKQAKDYYKAALNLSGIMLIYTWEWFAQQDIDFFLQCASKFWGLKGGDVILF